MVLDKSRRAWWGWRVRSPGLSGSEGTLGQPQVSSADLERGSEGRAGQTPRGARIKVNLNPNSTAGELGGAGGRGDGGRAGRGGGRRRGRGAARRRPRAPGAPRRAQAGGRRGRGGPRGAAARLPGRRAPAPEPALQGGPGEGLPPDLGTATAPVAASTCAPGPRWPMALPHATSWLCSRHIDDRSLQLGCAAARGPARLTQRGSSAESAWGARWWCATCCRARRPTR